MQIAVDVSLFVNFVLNFFIIKCTASCTGQKSKFAVLSSALGAAVAVILPLFCVGQIAKIAVQLLLALAILFLCFEVKPAKQFFVAACVFFGFTFLFGGAVYAAQNVFGNLSVACLLLIAGVVYVVARIVIRCQNKVRRLKKFSFKVTIMDKGKTVTADGFLDSGNVLYDPITKKPIVLITFDIFNKLKPNINYISALSKQVDLAKLDCGHYVKVNTVASGTSILVFTVDNLQIVEENQKRDYQNIAVGLSFSGFDKTLGRQILLHQALA